MHACKLKCENEFCLIYLVHFKVHFNSENFRIWEESGAGGGRYMESKSYQH